MNTFFLNFQFNKFSFLKFCLFSCKNEMVDPNKFSLYHSGKWLIRCFKIMSCFTWLLYKVYSSKLLYLLHWNLFFIICKSNKLSKIIFWITINLGLSWRLKWTVFYLFFFQIHEKESFLCYGEWYCFLKIRGNSLSQSEFQF